MAEISVHTIDGEVAKSLSLDSSAFATEPRPDLMHRVVTAQLAKRRAGTHKTKGRSEVAGSTKKLYRQKGTGRARRGDIKAPILRGGGIVFGPKPRDYAVQVPKRIRRLALGSALTARLNDGVMLVVERLDFETPKTKQIAALADALGVEKEGMLIIVGNDEEHFMNVRRSNDNVPGGKTLRSIGTNVYDLLRAKSVVFTEQAIQEIEERFAAYA